MVRLCIRIGCIVVLAGLSLAGSVCMGQLYVSDDNANLWVVDTETGEADLVGRMGRTMLDIAFSATGELVGLAYPDDLYRVDIARIGADRSIPTELLGPLGIYTSGTVFNRREVPSLSFGPDGRLFFATADGLAFRDGLFTGPTGWLGSIDSSVELIGDIGFPNGGDLAFASDGTLYMNSCTPTGLFLVCSAAHDNGLVRIDPPNGTGVEFGSIGFPNVFGMDFLDETLYGVTNQGELISIDTRNGVGTLVALINPIFRATGAATIPVPIGDMDLSGDVDFGDMDDFVLGLNDPIAYENIHGVPPAFRGDIDEDGDHDFDDIPDFVALLSSSQLGVIPEPSTLALVFVGLLCLAIKLLTASR